MKATAVLLEDYGEHQKDDCFTVVRCCEDNYLLEVEGNYIVIPSKLLVIHDIPGETLLMCDLCHSVLSIPRGSEHHRYQPGWVYTSNNMFCSEDHYHKFKEQSFYQNR